MRKLFVGLVSCVLLAAGFSTPVAAATTQWTVEAGSESGFVADATSTFTPMVFREIPGGRLLAWIEDTAPNSQVIKMRTFSDTTGEWTGPMNISEATGVVNLFKVGAESGNKISFLWQVTNSGKTTAFATSLNLSDEGVAVPAASTTAPAGIVAAETIVTPTSFGFMTVQTIAGGATKYLMYHSDTNSWTEVAIPIEFTNFLVLQIVELRDGSLGWKFADLQNGETAIVRYESPLTAPSWGAVQSVPGLGSSVLVPAVTGPSFLATFIWNDSETSEITYAHLGVNGVLGESKNNSKLFSPLSQEAAFVDGDGNTWFIGVDGTDLQVFTIDAELEIQDDAELPPTTVQSAQLLDNGAGGYLAVWVETLAVKSFASGTDPESSVKTVVSAESGTPNFQVTALRHDDVFSMALVNSVTNTVGVSAFSFAAPSAPTNVSLIRTSRTTATATWQSTWPDAQTFTVVLKSGNTVVREYTTDALSVSLTDLVAFNPYTVTIRATSNGVQGLAVTSAELVPLRAPSAVRAIAVTAKKVSGKKQLTVKWNVPATLGGAELKNYVVELRVGKAGVWKKVATTKANVRSYVLKKTVAGSSYTFRITANTFLPGTSAVSKTTKV